MNNQRGMVLLMTSILLIGLTWFASILLEQIELETQLFTRKQDRLTALHIAEIELAHAASNLQSVHYVQRENKFWLQIDKIQISDNIYQLQVTVQYHAVKSRINAEYQITNKQVKRLWWVEEET